MDPQGVCQAVFHTTLTAFQLQCVETVLKGQDVFVILRTGGGKTLVFTISACCLGGVCLVISPLISLIRDQREKLEKLGVTHRVLTEPDATSFPATAHGGTTVVYCTPESITKLQGRPPLTTWQASQAVKLIVVDEAHCVWNWGPTFRESYLRCGYLRTLFPSAPMMALTATASSPTIKRVAEYLLMRQPSVLRGDVRRHNLYIKFIERQAANPMDPDALSQLLRIVRDHVGSGLVFTLSRKEAEHTATFLNGAEITCAAYHAGLADERKTAVQDAWLKGDIQVVCCTVAFGMGIDKSDVRFVVHSSLPASLEEYAQEIGRAGRDNNASTCITLWHPEDEKRRQLLWTTSGYDREMRLNLDRMMLFAETTNGCRHQMMEREFSNTDNERCMSHCDLCEAVVDRIVRSTVDVREFVAAVRQALPTLRGCDKGQRHHVHTFIRGTSSSLMSICKTNVQYQHAVRIVAKPIWNRVRLLMSRSLWAWGVLFQDGPNKDVFFDDLIWKNIENDEGLCLMHAAEQPRRGRKRPFAETKETSQLLNS
jgi:ATP-dependent DNA helicase RecQ